MPGRALLFLSLSGLATGASWVCYFRALKVGEAYRVAPIDKLSVVLVALFAVLFLGERPAPRDWLGIACVGFGVLLLESPALTVLAETLLLHLHPAPQRQRLGLGVPAAQPALPRRLGARTEGGAPRPGPTVRRPATRAQGPGVAVGPAVSRPPDLTALEVVPFWRTDAIPAPARAGIVGGGAPASELFDLFAEPGDKAVCLTPEGALAVIEMAGRPSGCASPTRPNCATNCRSRCAWPKRRPTRASATRRCASSIAGRWRRRRRAATCRATSSG